MILFAFASFVPLRLLCWSTNIERIILSRQTMMIGILWAQNLSLHNKRWFIKSESKDHLILQQLSQLPILGTLRVLQLILPLHIRHVRRREQRGFCIGIRRPRTPCRNLTRNAELRNVDHTHYRTRWLLVTIRMRLGRKGTGGAWGCNLHLSFYNFSKSKSSVVHLCFTVCPNYLADLWKYYMTA